MSQIYIDVDTAVNILVNQFPLIDDTDFKTREIAIAYNQAGMDLMWNFTTSAGVVTQTAVTPTTAGDYDWANVSGGMYKIEIPASAGASINNNAEGSGFFTGICTGVLAWKSPIYCFRAVALNNALIDGGDVLDVNVTELVGVAQSANDLKDFADAGYDPATNKVQGVVLVDTTTTNTDMRGTDNALPASSAPTNFGDLAITATTGLISVGTNNDKTGYGLSGTQTFNVTGNRTGNVSGSVGSVTSAITLPTIPANWISAAGIAASALDGKGNWNIGKTGYTLTQSFPANFPSMVISAGGSVDSLVQGFINTALTEATVGRIAGNFDTFYENADAATTKTVDDVGAGGGLNAQQTRDAMKLAPSVGAPAAESLDEKLDNVETSTAGLSGEAMRGTDGANTVVPATNAQLEARTPSAAELAYIVSNAKDGKPITFSGGTTTTAILATVDGVTASSTNDKYKGRIFIFNAGTVNEEATDVTSYDGATKTATITAITAAVSGSTTANMK